MVWVLVPQHPSLGSTKYYFISTGTYRVGRKDCAVIIQTDRTVSRLHAEIRIEPVTSQTSIIIKDLSKFGSFVNRSVGSKPVFSLPNKEVTLKDGDIVTFGTDNSSFRVEHIPIIPHIATIVDKSRKLAATNAIKSIGVPVMDKWCSECTHLIVEDGSCATDVVVQAVSENKPVLTTDWIEAVAAKGSISSELPDISRYTPSLSWKIDGDLKLLKIIEPGLRQSAFRGYKFYLGPTHHYKYQNILHSLIEASGGKLITVTTSNVSETDENILIILPSVHPELLRDQLRSMSHIRRTNEDKFIAAVLSGQLKEEYLEVITDPEPSVSSDETMEAAPVDNLEDEVNSCAQVSEMQYSRGNNFKPAVAAEEPSCFQSTRNGSSVHYYNSVLNDAESPFENKNKILSKEQFKVVKKLPESNPSSHSDIQTHIDKTDTEKKNVVVFDNIGDYKADIEYRKDLIVRRASHPVERNISEDPSVQNFKRFRKKHAESGNSFTALVPFAKDPYRESDFNKEVQEYMHQEKRRKEAEALAEDLFNAEKLKRKKGEGASIASTFMGGKGRQRVKVV